MDDSLVRELLHGAGWMTADWAVAFISIVAAATTMLALTGWPRGLARIGVFIISAGWLMVALRMLLTLIPGGDPAMPHLVVIGLSCIGAGQTFYVLGRWMSSKPRRHGGSGVP